MRVTVIFAVRVVLATFDRINVSATAGMTFSSKQGKLFFVPTKTLILGSMDLFLGAC